MIQRLLGESRSARLRLHIDCRKSRLADELRELREEKRALTSELENASEAERCHAHQLRRTAETFEAELNRVRREAAIEVKTLVSTLLETAIRSEDYDKLSLRRP